jgi:DNA-directed RNA polymerase subunit M/transcription elongation factor TFIIS
MSPQRKNNSIVFVCPSCGFVEEVKERDFLVSNEKIKPKKLKGGGVGEDKNEFATYNHICKKCGYDKAQILDLGIFYSDEDNLIMLKCGRCGFSERIGRKVS